MLAPAPHTFEDMSIPLRSVRVSGRVLTVLTRPLSVAEAFEAMSPNGSLTAVVKMPVGHVVGPDIDYDTFYDRLAAALVDLPAYGVDYEVLAVAEGGAHLYVEVVYDVTAMVESEGAEADFLRGVDPDVVTAALARAAA